MSDVHERMSLPEGAVVDVNIEVVGYFAREGGPMKYGVRVQGEQATSNVVGLLEMAKVDIIKQNKEA